MPHPATPDPCPPQRLVLPGPLHLTAGDRRRREYAARLIQAGRVRNADNSPGPFFIPAAALRQALDGGLFTGLSAFVDHAGFLQDPSLRDLAGYTLDARWNEPEQAVEATIRLLDGPAGSLMAGLLDQLLADQAAGRSVPDVGLSLVFWPEWELPSPPPPAPSPPPPAPSPLPQGEGRGEGLAAGAWLPYPPGRGAGGEGVLTLRRFRHIESVDFVFQPAAGGRILRALQALRPTLGASVAPPPPSDPCERSANMTHPTEVQDLPGPETEAAPPAGGADPAAGWLEALQEAATDALLQASGLPAPAVAYLRSQPHRTPAELRAAIEAQRELLAGLRADQVVQVGGSPPRGSAVSLGRTSLEQVQAAFEALLMGVSPPAGVQPLTGVREFYHLMSGDYEITGVYQPDRVYLANVTSSSMAGLVANALNKVVANLFQTYPRWWEPIVTEMDFTTLQQVRWITLGGVGELPTVPEGGAYTELTWDDKTETADFVKKGGYLGITIETIDKDDTGRVRAAPRALAQAAWLTLSKSIAAIFTANAGTGPVLSDGLALFHANHGNLGSSALSWAAYDAVRTAMMKQTELNSGERLGALTRPYFLIVPIDLETVALQILGSEGEPGTADNDVNPLAEGDTLSAQLASARRRVVVCPIWTDTNDWAAAAHPNLYPSIGLGYRYGRTPQIFSVASPTGGLMFTNDTLPVKVRFFYATGPIDHRGLYKQNVAS